MSDVKIHDKGKKLENQEGDGGKTFFEGVGRICDAIWVMDTFFYAGNNTFRCNFVHNILKSGTLWKRGKWEVYESLERPFHVNSLSRHQ